jgi:hypothetical protein
VQAFLFYLSYPLSRQIITSDIPRVKSEVIAKRNYFIFAMSFREENNFSFFGCSLMEK